SSCSYAAAALARTLFVRGADFTAAQAFMFASTNLVVELGIVLWLLMGWSFALAELVGGALMIALLAVGLPRTLGPRLVAEARTHAGGDDDADGDHCHAQDPPAHHPGDDPRDDAPADPAIPFAQRIRSHDGWVAAARATLMDLRMLRTELVVGFVLAGVADTALPIGFWRSLFVTGHGFWSALENVVLGPFLAIISFVCSIGNVPLAAALWSAGITFGGVVAFVFADLITLPLLLVYRRTYGGRVTARLLATFWATMSLAGLAVDYLFRALSIAPDRPVMHGHVGRDAFGWTYTTFLDLVALIGFAYLVRLSRTGASSTPEAHPAHA
ncbi:MAG TPA: permease, partial [Mycobacteriales bacterium]|nr:permease [Mycobacteriales bacterium]